MPSLAYQLAQRSQIDHIQIFVVAFSFRSFQVHRHLAIARVVHQQPKRLQAKMPFADMFMPIDARA